MASDEAEAALSMGACKEAQTAYTVFVTVVGDFKANRSYCRLIVLLGSTFR